LLRGSPKPRPASLVHREGLSRASRALARACAGARCAPPPPPRPATDAPPHQHQQQ
jgi:hypothetical protein